MSEHVPEKVLPLYRHFMSGGVGDERKEIASLQRDADREWVRPLVEAVLIVTDPENYKQGSGTAAIPVSARSILCQALYALGIGATP